VIKLIACCGISTVRFWPITKIVLYMVFTSITGHQSISLSWTTDHSVTRPANNNHFSPFPHKFRSSSTPGGGGRVTATASFGGDCGTDRPSHGAFYDRRSRFLCRCRTGVEQPSALGYVISVPSGFPEASLVSFIYSNRLPVLATLSTFYMVTLFFLQFYVFLYYAFSFIMVLCTVVLQSYDVTPR